ncbi:MAG: FAD-dependent oxidoreductase [Gaiellales bacterium]
MSSSEVAVVGGGAVGASVAYELSRAGASVALFEERSDVGEGCSWGSAGLIAPSHAAPLATPRAILEGIAQTVRPAGSFSFIPRREVVPWLGRFVRAALTPGAVAAATHVMSELCGQGLELHGEWHRRGIESGFRPSGVLYVQRTARRARQARSRAERQRATGLDVTTLGADEARRFEPALRSPAGAVFYPGDAMCDAPAFVKCVVAAARAHGATVRLSSHVRSLAPSPAGVSVQLEGETHVTKHVVVASGTGSVELLMRLGCALPVAAGRGFAVELEPRERDPVVPIFIEEDRVLATPLRGRLRVSGVLVIGSRDTRADTPRALALSAALGRSVRDISDARVLRRWTGLRPMSPDGLPIIGSLPREPSVLVATGHGMMGMTLAPVTAVLLRRGLEGGEAPAAAVSPSRFGVSRSR